MFITVKQVNLKVSLSIDKVSVVSDVSVDTWLGWEGASLSPGGSTDSVFGTIDGGDDWSAGVTLAGVFASFADESSAEHTLKS